MEQRKYVRSNMIGMEVDISDRAGFCTGTIRDISRFGICITDIPRKLHAKNGLFDVVITGQGHSFRLKAQEKWETKDGLTTIVGAFIDNVPWDWTEMVMQHEPESDDIWGSH